MGWFRMRPKPALKGSTRRTSTGSTSWMVNTAVGHAIATQGMAVFCISGLGRHGRYITFLKALLRIVFRQRLAGPILGGSVFRLPSTHWRIDLSSASSLEAFIQSPEGLAVIARIEFPRLISVTHPALSEVCN